MQHVCVPVHIYDMRSYKCSVNRYTLNMYDMAFGSAIKKTICFYPFQIRSQGASFDVKHHGSAGISKKSWNYDNAKVYGNNTL